MRLKKRSITESNCVRVNNNEIIVAFGVICFLSVFSEIHLIYRLAKFSSIDKRLLLSGLIWCLADKRHSILCRRQSSNPFELCNLKSAKCTRRLLITCNYFPLILFTQPCSPFPPPSIISAFDSSFPLKFMSGFLQSCIVKTQKRHRSFMNKFPFHRRLHYKHATEVHSWFAFGLFSFRKNFLWAFSYDAKLLPTHQRARCSNSHRQSSEKCWAFIHKSTPAEPMEKPTNREAERRQTL